MDTKMILGTVQLGLDYGINNCIGKPSIDEAYKILEYAYSKKISTLDTASSYGDSEDIIGNYIVQRKHPFNLCTKLPVNIKSKKIKDYFYNSINKLNVSRLNVYYLHRFEQCKDESIIKQMKKLKDEGLIELIGVSIYEPKELKYIVDELWDIIDVVQLPYNIFDNSRWLSNNLLKEAKEKRILLYARSIYLQGLVFLNPDSDKAKQLGVVKQIQKLCELAESQNISLQELAMNFVATSSYIDKYLVGCEKLEQIKTNIETKEKIKLLSNNIISEIVKISSTISERIIDPRKWSD